ncbi:hypothetical protein CR156_00720 [Stenotrophomonas lactitubi]|nr:hypothetical protein CR156_00720 [Stenotrophomonas lactitubi]
MACWRRRRCCWRGWGAAALRWLKPAERCVPAGLRPAPAEAVVPAAGRQPQQQRQKLAIRGMAGWVRWQGTAQVRPCSLGRAIHGAHAPATGPTPPSTVFRDLSGRRSVLLVGVDLGRHKCLKNRLLLLILIFFF